MLLPQLFLLCHCHVTVKKEYEVLFLCFSDILYVFAVVFVSDKHSFIGDQTGFLYYDSFFLGCSVKQVDFSAQIFSLHSALTVGNFLFLFLLTPNKRLMQPCPALPCPALCAPQDFSLERALGLSQNAAETQR